MTPSPQTHSPVDPAAPAVVVGSEPSAPERTSLLKGWVRTHIAYLLTGFGRTQQAGYVFVGLPIHDVWGRPGTHHRPDVCYISVAKLPTLTDDDFVRVVPDLVVEVVSAEDTVGDVEGRVFDYTMAGVKAVWLVYPAIKMCRVQYPDGTGRMLNITGTLDGGQALPGFTCPVVDLFPKT